MKRHDPDSSRLAALRGFTLQAWSRILPVLMLCAWALWAPNAGALGFRVPNQDASAIARGNAFVATADNPSAIYYNPSGITQLEGQNIQAGSLFYLGIYGDYHSPSGQDIDNDPEVIAVPTLQYTITPKEWPVSFGFGIYEPFGFSVKWPDDVPFRQESLKGSLTYITMNPVVAWKVLPSLSIGAGPTFNYSRIDLVYGLLPTPFPCFRLTKASSKVMPGVTASTRVCSGSPTPSGPLAPPTAAAAAWIIMATSASMISRPRVNHWLGQRRLQQARVPPNCHRRRLLPAHQALEPGIRCGLGRLDLRPEPVDQGTPVPVPEPDAGLASELHV